MGAPGGLPQGLALESLYQTPPESDSLGERSRAEEPIDRRSRVPELLADGTSTVR
ncbi:MAG: hypothetical protein AAF961_09990 [Planctomycetota bacterium]